MPGPFRFVDVLRSRSTKVIILVRHPPSVLNDSGRVRAQLDPPLAPEGPEVVRKTASQFVDVKVDRIFTDNTIRTKAMAAGIAKVTKAPVTVTNALSTWNLGRFAGKKIESVAKEVEAFMVKTPSTSVPGGESFERFALRFIAFLTHYYSKEETVVFVTHGRPIMTAKAWQDADADRSPLDLAGQDLSPEPTLVETGGIVILSNAQPFKVVYP
jgi:broad specificity phosphatase PhoE